MKLAFNYFIQPAVAVAFASLIFGCSKAAEPVNTGTPNPEFSQLLLKSTNVVVPATKPFSPETNPNSLSKGSVPFTIQDRQDFAAHLYLGPAVKADVMAKPPYKSNIWFMGPRTIIIWFYSEDDSPGIIRVTKLDGPPRPATDLRHSKVLSMQYFELSESANNFARNWVKAHLQ